MGSKKLVASICLVILTLVSSEPLNSQIARAPRLPSIRVTAIHQSGSIYRYKLPPSVTNRIKSQVLVPGRTRIPARELQPVLPKLRRKPEEFRAFTVQRADLEETAPIYLRETPTEFRRASTEDLSNPDVRTIQNETIIHDDSPEPAESPERSEPARREMRLINVTRVGDAYRVTVHPGSRRTTEAKWEVEDSSEIDSSKTGDFLRFVQASGLIVHLGDDLPVEWLDKIRENRIAYARVSARSPNRRYAQIRKAVRLAEDKLRPDRTVILSALPRAQGWISPFLELWKMQMPWSWGYVKDWKQLHSRINEAVGSSPVRLDHVTRDTLVDELLRGGSDVLFLVAHNEERVIYLTGIHGEKISFDDIAQLQRGVAPDRIVVLITCEAGGVNQSMESLAEVILRNKLARTVFASPEKVNAKDLPDLLKDVLIHGRSVREAFQKEERYSKYKFVQIVRDSLRWLING